MIKEKKEDIVIFDWLKINLPADKTVIDIGARDGNWFDKINKTSNFKEAHLFEPIPDIAESTQIKFQNNPRITVHNIALSDVNSLLEFYIDTKSGAWSGLKKHQHFNSKRYKTINVNVKTVDSFNFKNIGLIKIDSEGNELNIIKGAIDTIKNYKPIIYFECADIHMVNYNYTSDDIFDLLISLQYNLYNLDFRKINKTQLKNYAKDTPSFYHNFIAVYSG